MDELTKQEREILTAIKRMQQIRIYKLYPQLSPVEAQLLSCVDEHEAGMSVSALAQSLQMPMPAISRMMRGMETRGLITRQILPTDRRSILVSITQEGQAQYRAFNHKVHCFLRELLETADSEAVAQLLTNWNVLMDQMEVLLQEKLKEELN